MESKYETEKENLIYKNRHDIDLANNTINTSIANIPTTMIVKPISTTNIVNIVTGFGVPVSDPIGLLNAIKFSFNTPDNFNTLISAKLQLIAYQLANITPTTITANIYQTNSSNQIVTTALTPQNYTITDSSWLQYEIKEKDITSLFENVVKNRLVNLQMSCTTDLRLACLSLIMIYR